MSDLELIAEWLHWFQHNQGRAAGSVEKYFINLRVLAEWLAGRRKSLLRADREDLERYTGMDAHRRGIAPRSRRPIVAAVRGFYKWAHARGLIDENPARDLPYPSVGRKLPRGMSLANAEKLLMQPGLESLMAVRDTAIIATFIGCGLRLGGLQRMTMRSLVFVEDDGDEQLYVRVTEKGDRERIMPAPAETRLLIRAYLGHPDLASMDRSLPDGDEVLWVSLNNRTVPEHEWYGRNIQLSRRAIGDMLEKYALAAGIPRDEAHPHALRHLYGTELTESDVQQRKIQVLMGHRDSRSTEIYQHVAMRSLVDAVKQGPMSRMRTPVTELAKVLGK